MRQGAQSGTAHLATQGHPARDGVGDTGRDVFGGEEGWTVRLARGRVCPGRYSGEQGPGAQRQHHRAMGTTVIGFLFHAAYAIRGCSVTVTTSNPLTTPDISGGGSERSEGGHPSGCGF